MNEDTLKGKWKETKGRVKERWGKLTGNDLGESEGKREKLLGLLQKKYGCIRDKVDLEYKESVELSGIVSSIRQIMNKKSDIMAIEFIAHYGRPLFAKKHENQRKEMEENHGCDTDCYFDTRLSRRNTHMAPQ
ncbi:MAG: CsbD family protein [Syntrophales bacterium]